MQAIFAPGRGAVITGGAAGIGLAVARKCAIEFGMKVCIADTDADSLSRAKGALEADGATEVLIARCDVTKVCDYESLADTVFAAFGDVAFLHLNAGVAAGFSAFATPLKEWKLTLDVNVWGIINGLHVFVPRMIQQRAPSKIVATSSLAGLLNSSLATGTPYVVSKHSVTLIMESLQNELRSSGSTSHVSSHVWHPGIVRTSFSANSRRSIQELGIQDSQGVGFDENFQNFEKQKGYEESTLSIGQLVDGVWEAMSAGKFYCIVSPPAYPVDLMKALVGLRAQDIIRDLPPLSQHVPALQKQSEERLQAILAPLRAKI